MKKLLLTVLCIFTLCAGLFAKNNTYIYDYWAEYEKSPDAYRVVDVLYASDFGSSVELKNPSGLFCLEDSVFVCDSGNNRILELKYNSDKTLSLVRIIDHFNSNGQFTPDMEKFNAPSDLFINKDRSLFICDTNNGRILKLDKDLNLLFQMVEPDDPTYEKGKQFNPKRVVADSKGRAYVMALGVNKGFIKYEYDGTFASFFGASTVMYDALDLFWKKFATKAQREQMATFVPTEYSNCYIDEEGLIYAVTKSFESYDLLSDKAKPIRRLNALGNDILIKNGHYLPIGDLQWGDAGGIKDPARFVDITVLDNDVYLALDETHGRIFAYNSQGFLLFAFGGRGNIEGNFRIPCSLDHVGKDLFVLDELNSSITIFTPTKYGELIYGATEDYAEGEYDASAEKWDEVLKINGNYDLAYVGLGRSYLRKEQYKEAMNNFKITRTRKLYSKAYGYYRKEWIEANIGIIGALIIAAILIPAIVRIISRFIKELKSL